MVRADDVARTDGGQDAGSDRQRRGGQRAVGAGGGGSSHQATGGGQTQPSGGGTGGHAQGGGSGQQAAGTGGRAQRGGGAQQAAGHQGAQTQRGRGRGGGGGGGGHASGSAYGGGQHDLVRWVKLGTSTYLLFGLGTAFTLFLFTMLAPANGSSLGSLGGSSPFGSMGNTSSLFGFVALGWILMLFLVAGLSTALGLFVGRDVDAGESAPVAGATTNAAGALIGTVVMLVLILILAPGGAGGAGGALGQLIAPLLGLTAGAAVTGAAAAEIGQRSASW